MSKRRLSASAPVFAALGDETRLALVSRLAAEGPMSIAQLTAGTHVTRQAITKHLHVLESAGLVRSEKAGRETLWELALERIDDAKKALDFVSAQWDDALGRLRAFVER